MAMEEPKRPASAYFLFVNATREQVQKELNTTKFGEVTKVQADRWKTLAAGEKEKFEKQAADAKAKYEKDLAAYKEAGGEVGKGRKDKKAAKAAKAEKLAQKEANADRPKKPTGGGYGMYMRENREALQKECAGKPASEVSKLGGERWKALPEDKKKPFDAKFKEAQAKWHEEMKAWKEAKGIGADEGEEEEAEEAGEAEASSPEKPKEKPAPKRGKAASTDSPPAKKAKGRGKAKEEKEEGPTIDAGILAQAEKLSLLNPLKNLAAREDMKSFSAEKMLSALQKSGGLVNKAKASLLGA